MLNSEISILTYLIEYEDAYPKVLMSLKSFLYLIEEAKDTLLDKAFCRNDFVRPLSLHHKGHKRSGDYIYGTEMTIMTLSYLFFIDIME